MFFHGIDYEYMLYQYPILSPRLSIMRQNKNQRLDRKHLLKKFGFEPVHFLESSKEFTIEQCLSSCFSFGNVVFAYDELGLPILQLSVNEVGVPVANLKKATLIFVQDKKLIKPLIKLFPSIPVLYIPNNINISKLSNIKLHSNKSKSKKRIR